MAATRSFGLLAILLFEIADGFGKSPFLDIDGIVAWREYAASADLLARRRGLRLLMQTVEKLVEQPARDHFALARIDEAEVEHRHQQHFPIELHVGKQLLPIDLAMAFQDHVRDI